ncbi:MAG: hypothetical protein V1772_07080 [Chloroflexota bacterium]
MSRAAARVSVMILVAGLLVGAPRAAAASPEQPIGQAALLVEGSQFGAEYTDTPIPDYNYVTGEPGRARVAIPIAGAPAGATVTRLRYRLRVAHTRPGGIALWLANDAQTRMLLWDRLATFTDRGYDDDVEYDTDIVLDRWAHVAFDGDAVNQTWYLEAEDWAEGGEGLVDYLELYLYYGEASSLKLWVTNFGYAPSAGGWTSDDRYPRLVADVNGDRLADIVGFGNAGVLVALSTGSSFGAPQYWLNNFGYADKAGGWKSNNTYPRTIADVNGDGRGDAVGFGNAGVWVALSNGASFGAPQLWLKNLGYAPTAGGWVSFDQYPRLLADVNGDRMADAVGFGFAGVWVALSTGTSFEWPRLWSSEFGYSTGPEQWTSHAQYPRAVADMDGDGRADPVGFGRSGVWVGQSAGTAFGAAQRWLAAYGTDPAAGGWSSYDRYPRLLGDVNGETRRDVVGFGLNGIVLAYSTGWGLGAAADWARDLGYSPQAGGWISQNTYPRRVADVTGDGKADMVGFGHAGVYVLASE